MKILDVLNSDPCKKVFGEIQEFVDLSLSEYNDFLEKNEIHYSDKDIFDFVWGTINLNAAEVCILDSPLLQRLRRIRQLGLASMVYCNADSSRFSHTLGVTEVSSRMANLIKPKINLSHDDIKNFDPVELVRLAAIFHDSGHMFYSHVSELFFSYDKSFPRYEELTSLKTFFCGKTATNASLHEIFSVMIVFSEQTIRMLKLVSKYFPKTKPQTNDDYTKMVEYIASLIIGSPIDRFILPYSTIINSSIDADKIDYLSRDSECTKVPIAVDLARIIQKLDVVDTKKIQKADIWNDYLLEAHPYKIMAVKSSARRVFWQLSNARSSLYESVYHHHKVLTAETMFRVALKYLFKDNKNISFKDIMCLTDDTFNDFWKYAFERIGTVDEESENQINNILKRIKNRALYKRVAVFSNSNLQGNLSDVGRFCRDIIQNTASTKSKKFIEELTEEYFNLKLLIEPGFKKPIVNPIFDFIASKHEALPSMPFENGDGYCTWSSSLMKQETIEAGKKSRQEQYYLVTDCIDRDIVFLAFEKLLSKYNLVFNTRDVAMCLKINNEKLNDTRKNLLEKNYYKDNLYILRDDIINNLMDQDRVNRVVEKYQSYMGKDACKITRERLIQYLRQFLNISLDYTDIEPLFNGILTMLEEAHYIDRSTFQGQMSNLFSKIGDKNYKRINVANLGNVFDSSSHLMYYLNDVNIKNNFSFETSINAALESTGENDCICFLDDGAYSGNQVISIFQELMGVPKEKRNTNENHVDELSEENKERIKNKNIILSYVYFNSASTDYITKNLKTLGINNVEIVFLEDLNTSAFDGISFQNSKQKDLVLNCLKTVGKEIINSSKINENGTYKDRWDKERADNAALGYNDARQMVVFSTNIPTYTISAFWANGKFNGKEWHGLFQRTKKERNDL